MLSAPSSDSIKVASRISSVACAGLGCGGAAGADLGGGVVLERPAAEDAFFAVGGFVSGAAPLATDTRALLKTSAMYTYINNNTSDFEAFPDFEDFPDVEANP